MFILVYIHIQIKVVSIEFINQQHVCGIFICIYSSYNTLLTTYWLHIIQIDEINVNSGFFYKKLWHYIYNLLLDILRNFMKLISFFIQIKSSKTIKNSSKSIKSASNGIN